MNVALQNLTPTQRDLSPTQRYPKKDAQADVLQATIAALRLNKLPVPQPCSGSVTLRKFVVCVTKTVHAQLTLRAKFEGVSVEVSVLTFIAQGWVCHVGVFCPECCFAMLGLEHPQFEHFAE